MDASGYKEVYFDIYCPTCKHLKKNEDESPCNECLTKNTNLQSHKPTRYEKGDDFI